MKSSHTSSLEIRAAVITVSTSRSKDTDISGGIIRELLEKAGAGISYYTVVPDKVDQIQEVLHFALTRSNCLIFCGGTGLTRDDCTIEAITPFIQKRIDGFGELFRWMSYQEIGTAAILSRALAGVIGESVVFCIPGSPAAARLAVDDLIIPECAHILSHARK
ncbi:MAG: MogA/MoaB family molybdenum cofactor biosynthesis protein [Methanomicrobiales archaeon]|nr:MogA/MoaB family molybdenum cofactor biosynthesis protein [Methanomicrobiales archaeon]